MYPALIFVLSFTTFAFSEMYAEARSDISITGNVLYNEPVNVTLVKNGTSESYTYFPVECSEFLMFAGVGPFEIETLSVD